MCKRSEIGSCENCDVKLNVKLPAVWCARKVIKNKRPSHYHKLLQCFLWGSRLFFPVNVKKKISWKIDLMKNRRSMELIFYSLQTPSLGTNRIKNKWKFKRWQQSENWISTKKFHLWVNRRCEKILGQNK